MTPDSEVTLDLHRDFLLRFLDRRLWSALFRGAPEAAADDAWQAFALAAEAVGLAWWDARTGEWQPTAECMRQITAGAVAA
jgi:nitroreductase